jgi:Tfp pilus assembly protein FimT
VTIIELIITMLIISIMSVAAFISIWGPVRSYRLNAATTKLLSDIRYAQTEARARNGWYGIRFQVAPTNRYNVYFTNGTSDIDVMDPADPSHVLDINLSTGYGGVEISAVSIAGSNKVEFSPRGIPYNDKNGSPLAADGSITISQGGASQNIAILRGTGRAEPQGGGAPGCSVYSLPKRP